MRITNLELKSVGVFDEAAIRFQPNTDPDLAEIHIFTGINGSGKSTLLYGLTSAINSYEINSRFRFKDDSSWVRVEFHHTEDSIGSITVRPNSKSNNGQSISGTVALYYREQTGYPTYGQVQDFRFDFAAFAYSGSRTVVSTPLQAIQTPSTNPLLDTLIFSKDIKSFELVQWIANTKTKSAFAHREGQLERASAYDLSIRRIELAVSQIIDSNVKFTFDYETLTVGLALNGEPLSLDVLPDGLKSIISWISDLLMRLSRLKWVDDTDVLDRSFILFLDEIEIHLHPAWQRKILPIVQKLFKNAQIFVATHSPFVVASIEDAWVYQLDVIDGRSSIAEIRKSMAGSSYITALDEVFGIEEYFDVETEQEFAEFYQLKNEFLDGDISKLSELQESGTSLAERGVEVRDIIGREFRQLKRITGQDIAA